MRNLLIVFLIICIVFLIIFSPFKTRVMGHVNLLEMKCYYSVKSWIIKLLCGKIEFVDGKIEVKNEESLISKNYQNEYLKFVGKEMLSEIDIKKLEVFFTGGFKENSFSSSS